MLPPPLRLLERIRRLLFQTLPTAMNDANIEHLLRSLRPAAPSAELTARVERDLALAEMFRQSLPPAVETASPSTVRHGSWSSSLLWAALGAAAAVLVMMVLPGGGVTTSPGDSIAASNPASAGAAKAVLPVSSTREWVAVEDQGISFATPDNPQRQMRVQSVERHQWIDPRDGAEYIVEVPQVESVALPVRFQ